MAQEDVSCTPRIFVLFETTFGRGYLHVQLKLRVGIEIQTRLRSPAGCGTHHEHDLLTVEVQKSVAIQ